MQHLNRKAYCIEKRIRGSMDMKVHPEQKNVFLIEDEYRRRSPFYQYLTPREYDFLCAPTKKEDFLFSTEKNFDARLPTHYLTREMQIQKLKKIISAKKFLKDLSFQYEKIFKEQVCARGEDALEKEMFFNSNLLYFIAATDNNEDTLGHSLLVARYTLLLTKELGFKNKKFLGDIERGALLHDIGKIGIPEVILRKPGSLTFAEKGVVKDHPLFGFEMIEEFDFLKNSGKVVLFHHEHYNGRGYPYSIVGEEIPLEARIFALADTLDAITTDRPYREGKSFREAIREIKKHSSSQFDPLVVEAFLSIPKERWEQTKVEAESCLRFPTIH